MQNSTAVESSADAVTCEVVRPAMPFLASRPGRAVAAVAEVAFALLAAAAMVALSLSIDVNPLVRIGQVSGLAGLGLRFALLGLLTLAVAIVISRRSSGHVVDLTARLSCSALAGLASGFVAGGVVVALRGTSLPLYAHHGDTQVLVRWAALVLDGNSAMPGHYPPLFVHTLVWWSSLTDTSLSFALKDFQIAWTAVFLPIAYLAWRTLFRPIPALVIGVTAALPLMDPYKPYAYLALVVLIPVLVKLLKRLPDSPNSRIGHLLRAGTVFGLTLGIIFLTYSGWFLWAAIGFVAAAAILFPWRRGAAKGLVLAGSTAVVFFVVSAVHLLPLLSAASTSALRDTYFYFDTYVDPAYIAMWRTDLPGDVGMWPPAGELAGVGVFTVLLVVGLVGALSLGYRRPAVITIACCVAGAWLLRFWSASQMFSDHNVRLYPRSTPFILYCLLLLTLTAGYLVFERLREATSVMAIHTGSSHGSGKRRVMVGVIAGMLLLLGSAASATADQYMPRAGNSLGRLAWKAHTEKMPNGECSAYLLGDCTTVRSDYEPRGRPR